MQAEIAERAYELPTGYHFARRYIEGKSVADICRDETGYGARPLTSSTVASPWDEVGSLFLGLRLVQDGDPVSAQEFQDYALATADVQDLQRPVPRSFLVASATILYL